MAPAEPGEARLCRIVVIDDHPFFRDGLMAWLDRQEGFACCGHAASVASALAVIEKTQPDLVLLDLQLHDGDGLELLRKLPVRSNGLHVIVISQKDESLFAERAMRAGAHGYVMKEEATETVLTAIRTVMSGGVHVSPKVSRRLLERLAHANPERSSIVEQLSDRELQVFQLLGRGLNTKATAGELAISPKTVDFYRESIKKKLGLPDGAALIRHATFWQQEGRLPSP